MTKEFTVLGIAAAQQHSLLLAAGGGMSHVHDTGAVMPVKWSYKKTGDAIEKSFRGEWKERKCNLEYGTTTLEGIRFFHFYR